MAAATSHSPLYLGLDLSTQQLKAIVIDSGLRVVAQVKVDFDKDFSTKYGVHKGVLVRPEVGEVFAPVTMYLEAIDLVLQRLQTAAPELMSRISAISGSCQQHGSVYWGAKGEGLLKSLHDSEVADKKDLLPTLLEGAFSREVAPNWQDQSTQAECDDFDARLGSAADLAQTTGSAAHHRFTGPQILRFRRKQPAAYAETARISLISSFVASVLLGRIAPMDIGDVCGMNLWDIQAGHWSEALLGLCGGEGEDEIAALRSKLGPVRLDGGGSMGTLAPYFARYGLSPTSCQIVPFTGDNPATILSLPLRPLDAIVSLGTSTTFLMVTPHYKPDPSYHFFNHPTTPGQYMFMLCYKNGGLAREKVRDTLPAPSTSSQDVWETFNKTVLEAPVLAHGKDDKRAKLGLYFYLNEIVPNIPAGTWRYTCSAEDGSDLQRVQDGDAAAAEAHWGPAEDARVIVESQALSLRLRSQPLVVAEEAEIGKDNIPQPRRIYLVGGGSLNPAIAQVLGQVLGGAEGVYRLDVGGNACALGGAYKALWAMERQPETETFDDHIGHRWKAEEAIEFVDKGYRPDAFAQYGRVLKAFDQMEQTILKEEQAKRKAGK